MAFGGVGLGPVPIGGAVDSWNGFALAGIVIAALVSDIYDGILARRWHCYTAVGVFASHRENAFVPLALVLGILCDLEGLLMSLIMPVWRKDINTLRAAWKLRNATRHQEFISSEPYAMRVVAFRIIWHTSELIIWRTGCESGAKMCVACRFLRNSRLQTLLGTSEAH